MMIELNDALYRKPQDIVEYPDEIASALIELLDNDFDKVSDEVTNIHRDDIIEGLYYIRTCAENDHNSSYFRALYNLLALVTQNYDFNLRKEKAA